SYEKASYSRGFSKSFGEIFYTSNYGTLQLTNGLASTPQMGGILDYSGVWCTF
ncbi:hypothetical protein CISIN_1g0406971mg, partial [Citrus sinensis]